MKRILAAGLILGLCPITVAADEVTDTLQSALQAYEDGDIKYALEELDYAKQLLKQMQSDALIGFLPEAPDGWTREVDTESGAALMVFGGGGALAQATYSKGDEEFTIMLLADNPMIMTMGAMIANAGAMGAKVVRLGRQKFMQQDGELTGLVGGRILVKAEGADPELMLKALKTIDYRGLSRYGE